MRRILALAIVPALLAGACSDDDDPDAADRNEASDETTTTARDGDEGDEAADDGASSDEDVREALDLDDDELAYAEALTGTFAASFSSDVGFCFAGSVVKAIGVESFTEADVTPEAIEAAGADLDLTEMGVSEPNDEQARAIGEHFNSCADLVEFFLSIVGSSLNEDQTACLQDELTEDFVEEFVVASLLSVTSDEAPADLQAQIDELSEACDAPL